MVRHFIVMSSSYTEGSRIALNITDDSLLNSEAIEKIIQDIEIACGDDVPLSTHFIETESDSWDSIVKYDPFFEGVRCVVTTDEFIEKINKSRVLTGLDVAVYILSRIRCTHLSLEKLVYFAYADYLCEYHEPLFEDQIFAFTRGPVIDSVYEAYKRSGSRYIEPMALGNDSGVHTNVKELPARSRILFARNGAKKLRSIEQTIQKYKGYSAGALVDLTHRRGSPWSYVDNTLAYQIIPDELIIAHHQVECV